MRSGTRILNDKGFPDYKGGDQITIRQHEKGHSDNKCEGSSGL